VVVSAGLGLTKLLIIGISDANPVESLLVDFFWLSVEAPTDVPTTFTASTGWTVNPLSVIGTVAASATLPATTAVTASPKRAVESAMRRGRCPSNQLHAAVPNDVPKKRLPTLLVAPLVAEDTPPLGTLLLILVGVFSVTYPILLLSTVIRPQ
jgi:hypothetical protein